MGKREMGDRHGQSLQGIPKNKDQLQMTQSVNRACLVLIHDLSTINKILVLIDGRVMTVPSDKNRYFTGDRLDLGGEN